MSTVWHHLEQDQGRADPSAPVRHAATDGREDGGDLTLYAKLAVSLGSIASTLQRSEDRRSKILGNPPQDYQVGGSVTLGSTGKGLIDLGSVPEGRVWEVRVISIGGSTATATPTGSAYAIAQGAPPNVAVLPTANIMDSWTSFSSGVQGSRYGTHQFFLVAPEHLWIPIIGGSTGVQWTASARIEDYDAEIYYATTTGVVE